jgi:hypothetical protein
MLVFNKKNIFVSQGSFEFGSALVESRSAMPFSPRPRRESYTHLPEGRSGPAKTCPEFR